MTTTDGLRTRLTEAVRPAMKARDRDRLRVLRTTLAAIDNAEAVPAAASAGALEASPSGVGATEVARRPLSELEVVAVVRLEVEEREQAATTYAAAGDQTRATVLRTEAEVLRELLGM